MINSVLSSAQKNDYQRDGFLLIPDFISVDICEHLIERANFLIQQFDPGEVKTVFSAEAQTHARHNYFSDSGGEIRYFFESGALSETGELKVEKSKSINKIGHALHDLDPVFDTFSRSHKLATLTQELGLQSSLLLQSMYICKQPFIGGEVTCHQDGTFLHAKNESVMGLWFALEDATQENGCMWALPGGHQQALKSKSIRRKNEITTEVYDASPWPLDKMVPLEVPRGSLVLLHSRLPHMSKENISARSRHAYTMHIMNGSDEYLEGNWLQRPAGMPFRGFF
jgi:phytanoyl-CoA hydroxylase